jgi:hypothetical protein
LVTQGDPTISKQSLREEKFDSVFAARNSIVINDEFVIYDPHQAVPKYIIHYTSSNTMPKFASQLNVGQTFQKFQLIPTRTYDNTNPKDYYCRMACGHYSTMQKNYISRYSKMLRDIDHVELVINKTLSKAFDAKKAEFQKSGIPCNEVLAFHGTNSANIDSIVRTNLDPSRVPIHGRVHGQGCYFSEFPDVSAGYGDGLLLFR